MSFEDFVKEKCDAMIADAFLGGANVRPCPKPILKERAEIVTGRREKVKLRLGPEKISTSPQGPSFRLVVDNG